MTEKQEWKLVRSESELRPGMVVRSTGCLNCGATHVAMLVRPCPHEAGRHRHMGTAALCHATPWAKAPTPPCWGPLCTSNCLDIAVREGRLFRLDTGIDDQAEQERGRRIYAPKKRERTR